MKQDFFRSVNPANGHLIKEYPTHDKAYVQKAISRAQKCWEQWRNTSLQDRSKVLMDIAQSIRSSLEQYAQLATLEMGKPIAQSRAELEKCAKTFEFYATNGARLLADEMIQTEAQKSYISYQPLGIVLAVMPWNFPYWQVFRAMAPILMSGNVMLLKHAANVSGCALAIEKILTKAKAPKGLFQTLLVPSDEVAAIIAEPSIAAVTFTGSTEAGRKVASASAYHLKKQVLELGGSDPYVVLQDASLDVAVQTCFESRIINTGQSCVAAKRFIVVRSLRKAFESKMKALMSTVRYGDPMDSNNAIGPMARIDLRDALHEQVMKSVAAGAQLLCGGFIPNDTGAFYPATLLSNVKKGMVAYQEELFGPVGVIIEAKDDTDAIRIANDSSFGLGAAVFSQNKKYAEEIARLQLQAGNCFVNAAVHSDPLLPFGGIKQSGYGRELSVFALREFVNIKTVSIH